jgi:plastocyanin
MMGSIAMVALGLALALAAPAPAAGGERHLVSQKGREFRPPALRIHAGDVVVFQNDDRTDHHIMAVEGPSEFSSHLLPRGSAFEVVFDRPGRWEIGCRIHPRMRMSLDVDAAAPEPTP